MTKTQQALSSEKLADIAIKGIQEKKGNEIVKLDLRKLDHAIADYFIVCHANSTTQVSSIADSVEDEIRKTTGEKPIAVEGKRNGEWVLIDFANVMVHVFQKEFREHYALEDLWADALIEQIND
ncbi:MAG: ribosome silencing factor [Salibacteraceae bacterium]|jgi:ribosome-associated protein|nr:ribosome silencing factor [Salibacteraceae bacterium]MDP4688002.1 ribosome silencing factor [Salibacteraceae bacterium]MDP4762109.1 ribosome silencing factor [Salibacteraceae bacterium]MDP4845594.1 ribosome silencing factor [Salibacteraceae bacterium]MDP4934374.1 ribosome silencing factor [Salibacteraceae bacterium]